MRIPSLSLLYCLSTVASLVFAQAAQPDFGPNVTIFDPSMLASAIQSAFDAVQATQAPPVAGQPYTSGTGQFNTVRHAFICLAIPKRPLTWARSSMGAGEASWRSNTP